MTNVKPDQVFMIVNDNMELKIVSQSGLMQRVTVISTLTFRELVAAGSLETVLKGFFSKHVRHCNTSRQL